MPPARPVFHGRCTGHPPTFTSYYTQVVRASLAGKGENKRDLFQQPVPRERDDLWDSFPLTSHVCTERELRFPAAADPNGDFRRRFDEDVPITSLPGSRSLLQSSLP
ncbi:hypothetical protein Bbelb_340060, partial [Branchiostoma belcheri]